jgi:RES domain
MSGIERLQRKSYSEIVARLQRARNMDVRSLTSSQVDKRIGLIMDGYPTVVIRAQMNGLYRARKNHGDEPWQSVSDLWYPPASAVRARGRFNEPGSSVFYACNRSTGAIYEIHPAVGDVITLLVVRSKGPFADLDVAHIGLERSLAPEMGFVPHDRKLRTNRRFQGMLEDFGISRKWLAVDDYLSEMATTVFAPHEEQDKYKITNSIGRLLLQIPSVHGLNFPSVATGLVSLNLCLRPEIADRFFHPAEAWMIKIEEKKERLDGLNQDGPFYRTTFIRKSEEIKSDGRIVWSDLLVNVTPEQIVHLDYRTRLPSEIEQQFKQAGASRTA